MPLPKEPSGTDQNLSKATRKENIIFKKAIMEGQWGDIHLSLRK